MKRIKYKLHGYWQEVPLIELPDEIEAIVLEEIVTNKQIDELNNQTLVVKDIHRKE